VLEVHLKQNFREKHKSDYSKRTHRSSGHLGKWRIFAILEGTTQVGVGTQGGGSALRVEVRSGTLAQAWRTAGHGSPKLPEGSDSTRAGVRTFLGRADTLDGPVACCSAVT
jgi:hypothetical protein